MPNDLLRFFATEDAQSLTWDEMCVLISVRRAVGRPLGEAELCQVATIVKHDFRQTKMQDNE